MKNDDPTTPLTAHPPLSQSLEEHLARLDRMKQRGRIELIMGTMFSGKSTELIKRINLLEIAGKQVLKIKFSADCRYKNKSAISTHTG